MRARHLPTTWLFTDERMGAGLFDAIRRLPRGGGIVFRHYGAPDRATLAARVRAEARRWGLVFVVAGDVGLARAWCADGVHLPAGLVRPAPGLLLTAAAHDRTELVAARRAGAALAFLSPVFATRSHPGGRTLGRVRFGLAARGAGGAVAALGGMTGRRFAALPGAVAWGAIDAWVAG